jgi:transaldolase/glucose-6-phosphate isomerase
MNLGRYEPLVKARLDRWQQDRVGARIWEKDFSVWSPTELPEITDRLGWINLPETMVAETESFAAVAEEIKAEGFKHVVLLGMGGSSLAPEVYQRALGNTPGFPELVVLDSTHPDHIRRVESQIDLVRTIFLVASKSGTTLESLSLFRYFFACLSEVTSTPASRFMAITDPGTPLEDLARERGFRNVFMATPDVGGRYSALTAFGLVPASLIGADVKDVLQRARVLARSCASSMPEPTNPCLALGAALGELTLVGRDKVTFFTCPSLEAFPDWLEQLIAESTGKDNKGIVPVTREGTAAPETYGRDRVFVYITTRQEADPVSRSQFEGLAAAGHPTVTIELENVAALAAQMFRWEIAVAAAGSILGIHPFNQPDVQLAKDLARRAMASREKQMPDADPALPVEPQGTLRRAFNDLLSTAKPGDYFAIQAYLASTPAVKDRLQAIRSHVRKERDLATTLGFGPRFLHSTGQLHKGGANTGIFLQLVDSPREDVPVPETDYTFAQLIGAQALGDYEALTGRSRRILRVNLGTDPIKGLDLLTTTLTKGPTGDL